MRAAGGDELKLYDITEYDVAEQKEQEQGTGRQGHAGGDAAEGAEECVDGSAMCV